MQIKQNANRAAGLVRQLLAFSRRQTLRPQVLQLNDVMSELQNLLRRLVGEKIELDVRYGRDLWLVKADLNQFEQVVVNLVVNARDAMPEGGIRLATSNGTAAECETIAEPGVVPAEYVVVEVSDSGHGIPPDVKAKMFEPFFTTKEVGKGTGLGLSMVYGIVKQTGGYIACESEPGEGATFRIARPLASARASVAAAGAFTVAPGRLALPESEGVFPYVQVESAAAVRHRVLTATTVAPTGSGHGDLALEPLADGWRITGQHRGRTIRATLELGADSRARLTV